jgi:hypothetical protein
MSPAIEYALEAVMASAFHSVVAGLVPVKRNRFIALDGAVKSVNREVEAKTRYLAGLKGYITSLADCPDGSPVTPEFVIGSRHQ